MNADDWMDMRDMQLELARLRAQLATARAALERVRAGSQDSMSQRLAAEALAAMDMSTKTENADTSRERVAGSDIADAGKDGPQ